MIQDVRKGVRSSFLYKRFAYYQSEGFTALINFLQDENLLDKFWEEFTFTSNSMIERELKLFSADANCPKVQSNRPIPEKPESTLAANSAP